MSVEDEAPAKALRLGLVAGGIDERVERLVGDAHRINMERRESDDMRWTFSISGEAVAAIRSHQKFAAGNQPHAREVARRDALEILTAGSDIPAVRRARRLIVQERAVFCPGRSAACLVWCFQTRTARIQHPVTPPAAALRSWGRLAACGSARAGWPRPPATRPSRATGRPP